MVSAKPAVVELTNVVKRYPGPRGCEPIMAVDHINFSMEDREGGEFLALLGPSGCGKSTVLNMINGLVQPTEGEVRTFGHPVTGPNPDAVTVQQAYTCFPWLTVLGNVEFGLRIQGKPASERRDIAESYLKRVGLADRLNAYPKELSGGMQQRTAIARALATRLPMILMDEPFGALDAQTRSDMQQMLLKLWSEEKNSIIFITHDITEALVLADRILVFSPRLARIIHDFVVPFDRPRPAGLPLQDEFINLSQAILNLLKHQPAGGQVRVTV